MKNALISLLHFQVQPEGQSASHLNSLFLQYVNEREGIVDALNRHSEYCEASLDVGQPVKSIMLHA